MADGDDIRPMPLFDGRVEAYGGENEDLDALNALTAPTKEPPDLLNVLEQGPITAAGAVQHHEQHLGAGDLEPCLCQGEWDRALEILTGMVHNGQAVNGAVNTEDPLDIRRAHPELVLLLRGHAYFDLRRRGETVRADAYYRDYIDAVYPVGISTGSSFVDALLTSLRTSATTGLPPSQRLKGASICSQFPSFHKLLHAENVVGRNGFTDKRETHRAVNDYLKVYFPEFRLELKEGSSRVWLFGEKEEEARGVRCLVCHTRFPHYDQRKLWFHLMRDRAGKQKLCEASTEYIQQQILAPPGEDNTDGHIAADAEAAPAHPLPLPPPPSLDPDAAAAAAPSTGTGPLHNDDAEAGAASSTPDVLADDDAEAGAASSIPAAPPDDDAEAGAAALAAADAPGA